MYDSGIKAKWDNENVIAFAKDKGVEQGIEKTQREIALKMKLANFPIEQISEITTLSISEIEAIQL